MRFYLRKSVLARLECSVCAISIQTMWVVFNKKYPFFWDKPKSLDSAAIYRTSHTLGCLTAMLTSSGALIPFLRKIINNIISVQLNLYTSTIINLFFSLFTLRRD